MITKYSILNTIYKIPIFQKKYLLFKYYPKDYLTIQFYVIVIY